MGEMPFWKPEKRNTGSGLESGYLGSHSLCVGPSGSVQYLCDLGQAS